MTRQLTAEQLLELREAMNLGPSAYYTKLDEFGDNYGRLGVELHADASPN